MCGFIAICSQKDILWLFYAWPFCFKHHITSLSFLICCHKYIQVCSAASKFTFWSENEWWYYLVEIFLWKLLVNALEIPLNCFNNGLHDRKNFNAQVLQKKPYKCAKIFDNLHWRVISSKWLILLKIRKSIEFMWLAYLVRLAIIGQNVFFLRNNC